MCRYAFSGPYKLHYACFTCRKMFRQINPHDRKLYAAYDTEMNGNDIRRKRHEAQRVCLCPECRQPMHDMGLDFKAPRQSNVAQWRKVEILHAHGYAYHSCGCGPEYRPATVKEIPTFIKAEEEARVEAARRKYREERKSKPKRGKASTS